MASYRWLQSKQRPDGRWQDYANRDIGAYFKAPWSFAAMGDQPAALRCLEHIEQHYLRPDGTIDHINNSKVLTYHPYYPHAHIAIGAILSGRSDLCEILLDFLIRQRHSQLHGWGGDQEGQPALDSISAASNGLAFLEGGREETAIEAARFLQRLLELQPRPETEFFTSVNFDGKLVTKISNTEFARCRCLVLGDRFQAWGAIGFPLLFLARLLEVSGDQTWLELAGRYFALLDRSPQAWNDLSSGKLAWACAVFYRFTGARAYRDRALGATRAMVSRQGGDGGWYACRNGEGQTMGVINPMGYEVSTEYALWLSLTGETLAKSDGRPWIPVIDYGVESRVGRCLGQVERIALRKLRTISFRWHRFRQ